MKRIALGLLGIIIVFFVFRFFLITVSDYTNGKKCNSSKFVADGGRIYIRLLNVSNIETIRKFSIVLIGKDGEIKKIKYQEEAGFINTYYTDYKILKSDTLLIEDGKNHKYKIYDFRNIAKRIKAGKDRGEYYCSLSYKGDYSENDNSSKGGSDSIDTIDIYYDILDKN